MFYFLKFCTYFDTVNGQSLSELLMLISTVILHISIKITLLWAWARFWSLNPQQIRMHYMYVHYNNFPLRYHKIGYMTSLTSVIANICIRWRHVRIRATVMRLTLAHDVIFTVCDVNVIFMNIVSGVVLIIAFFVASVRLGSLEFRPSILEPNFNLQSAKMTSMFLCVLISQMPHMWRHRFGEE